MKQELSGIIVPILTPLDAQENVDEARLRRQVDFVIEGGVNGILLFGSNGEFYTTEEDEMAHCLDVVLGQTAADVVEIVAQRPVGILVEGECQGADVRVYSLFHSRLSVVAVGCLAISTILIMQI